MKDMFEESGQLTTRSLIEHAEFERVDLAYELVLRINPLFVPKFATDCDPVTTPPLAQPIPISAKNYVPNAGPGTRVFEVDRRVEAWIQGGSKPDGLLAAVPGINLKDFCKPSALAGKSRAEALQSMMRKDPDNCAPPRPSDSNQNCHKFQMRPQALAMGGEVICALLCRFPS